MPNNTGKFTQLLETFNGGDAPHYGTDSKHINDDHSYLHYDNYYQKA